MGEPEPWAIDAFLSVPEWYWERKAAQRDKILLLFVAGDIAEVIDWVEYIHERISDWASD
jgi:hypothetical protein